MRFISPKTDYAFKKIFGSQQSQEVLIHFLNAILYAGQPIIETLEIIDPYQAPQIKGMKNSFLDVKATITGNRTVIIEMQVLNVLGFEKRVLYNAAKAFSTQLETGRDYVSLDPVIALTITDFEMFPHHDQVVSHYQLTDKSTLTDYTEGIELVFVELPKFNKTLDELETVTDQWIFFLQSSDTLEAVPESFSSIAAFQQAFSIAEESNLTRQEFDELVKQEFFIQDSRNAIEKGKLEGRAEGRAEGRKEQAIEIARSLLDLLDVETISQKTGLSVEEIEQL